MYKNPLSKKIGIIGGGQLGKMMILEAKKLGFYIITLDPSEDCPSHSISDEHIIANFDDYSALDELAKKTDVITYEFEHICVDKLLDLEDKGYKIYPTAKSLKIIQNKYDQKQYLYKSNIPVPQFMQITSPLELEKAGEVFGYPFLLKTCTGGYDGKGNVVVKTKDSIDTCFNLLGGGTLPLMAEKFVDFSLEISVLACRAIDGEISVYPVVHNIHIDNILDKTIVPADLSPQTTKTAMCLAHKVMEVFDGVGMFCVEMFVNKNNDILINEVAPRPHNSGHYTIEGCITSQFAQHIRAVSGLPLGDTSLIRPSVMRNLLGEDNHDGIAYVDGIEEALSISGVYVHIYGKSITKPKRKMGHITVTANTIDEAIEKSNIAKDKIKIIAKTN